jgi:hypothetical protein
MSDLKMSAPFLEPTYLAETDDTFTPWDEPHSSHDRGNDADISFNVRIDGALIILQRDTIEWTRLGDIIRNVAANDDAFLDHYPAHWHVRFR